MKAKRTMRQKTSPKVRQKLTLVYAAAGIAVAALVGVGLFIYINLGNSQDSMAATSSDYSVKSGFWDDKPTWKSKKVPVPSTDNLTSNIEIFKYITRVGDLDYKSGTLTITDTLVVDGNLTMGDNSRITIRPGGVLVVTGNLGLVNRFTLTNNGVFAIGRNAIVGNPNGLTFGGNSRDLYLLGKAYAGRNELPANTYAGIVKNENALRTEQPPIYRYLREGASTLPITLSYFKVTEEQGRVIISWTTDMEENNDYFSIERSADGKTFEQAATVAGAGNSTSKLVYSYTDSKALPGTSYYRLKQTDYDGKFTYSRIESVSRSASGMFANTLNIEIVAPNPFTDNFFMSYTLPSDGQVEVRLINMQGIVAFSEKIEGFEGQNQYEFYDRKGMKSGTYLLSISHRNATSKVERLIKR